MARIEGTPSEPDAWELRTRLGEDLDKKIRQHPQPGSYKIGLGGVRVLLNSAGHPSIRRAMRMVIEDTVQACDKETPAEIIRLAIDDAIQFRGVLLKQQPGTEKITGSISLTRLKRRLKNKISPEYFSRIFEVSA